MDNIVYKQIKEIVEEHYRVDEYPALCAQIAAWEKERPLARLKILDATPVFRNTLTKYLPMLISGVELQVGISDVMPYDPAIVAFLQDIGIRVVTPSSIDRDYDFVLDCAASFVSTPARIGYVELTRSGLPVYMNSGKTVFLADSGKIKQIETLLGTGESLFRALSHLGYTDFRGKRMVVFGTGKVGSGIIFYGHLAGAIVTAVSDLSSVRERVRERCFQLIDFRDVSTVLAALGQVDLIVTATGCKDAISDPTLIQAIEASGALLVNMGVEDEFGNGIPVSRVLNEKRPLNFILDEPTHLKYIETTMALHNTGAHYILSHAELKGVIEPPFALENALLEVVRREGVICDELMMIDDHG